MRKLSEFLNNHKEYNILWEEKDSFIKLLRSIKEDSESNLSIVDKGQKIVVIAPKEIHDRISLTWNAK